MPDHVLVAHDLTRCYRVGSEVISALDGIDLAVDAGEFLALMGPSGSGKSTLLNMLGGLDKPTAGQVSINGLDLNTCTEEQLAEVRRTHLGFIFQRHDLFPALTSVENVAFPLLLAGLSAHERHTRALDVLAQVGLRQHADRLPEELSGGQQQRVGIARALVSQPSLLLADEPTGNLDSATAAEIMDLLDSFRHALGLTLVMVTHDPEVAVHADRTLHLADGRILSMNGHAK